ncbi:MAG TPA: hypothetical protein VL400_11105, partial [Polyangiaceae bacterium]|nr:hypothetical protein [Polyangiaceae bacterium]
MKTLHLAACLSLLGVAACGDDTTSDTTTSGSGGGGAGGAATGGGGAGGNAPLACGADALAADLVGGTWDDRFTISGFTDHDGIAPRVNDFAFEPNGDLVAVGRFSWFEGQTVPPFMRFDGATQTWVPGRTTWELPLPLDGFQAVAIDPGGTLALATAAASFPGAPKKGEIWLDTGSGLESIGAFDGQVRTITWVGGELWVAGYFALSTGSSPIANLAVWDGAAWNEPPGGPADGPVYEIAEHDGTVYVGGSFSGVGGIGASNVASFDGAAWTPYDFADAVAIFALTTTPEGELYAGGAYGPFEEASGVARWTGTDWQTVGGGLAQYDTRGVVSDLVAHDGVIDMIGCFSSAGGLASSADSTPARSVARFDGASWQTLDDGTAPVQSGWFS